MTLGRGGRLTIGASHGGQRELKFGVQGTGDSPLEPVTVASANDVGACGQARSLPRYASCTGSLPAQSIVSLLDCGRRESRLRVDCKSVLPTVCQLHRQCKAIISLFDRGTQGVASSVHTGPHNSAAAELRCSGDVLQSQAMQRCTYEESHKQQLAQTAGKGQAIQK
jgi:hypothetical protein